MTHAPLIYSGKVRDIYDEGDTLLLVATDRLSAFDRAIANIPHKAKVLNQLSAFWFKKTRSIIENHFIGMPTPESSRVKKCTVFPIEVVVRGYITGTTNTSLWTLYQKGQRQFFETHLPEGLRKNQPLPTALINPTSKSSEHDAPLTPQEVSQIISPVDWAYIKEKALALFAFGQQLAQQKGLILVDTKYEFGRDAKGDILLVDECHTPDSSRYWRLESYQARFNAGLEPENFDKETIRLWFKAHCNPYEDKKLPQAPPELIQQVSNQYRTVYEQLTGQPLCVD